jgi:asparagine synthase (glutamine-hydrolysing)
VPDTSRDLDDAAAALSAMLPRAVARQSVADVPVAALLSGGIDSSLVVAAHRRGLDDAPLTFSVRFPDKSHDETDVAMAVREHCGTTHHVIDLDEWSTTPEAIMGLIRHFDQPFADTSLIPMYWIAKAVRDRGIICTLSGDGGDEVFGGYPLFWRADSLMRLMRLPDWACRAAGGAGRLLASRTRDWGRQAAKALALAAAGRRDAARIVAGLTNYMNEDEKAALTGSPGQPLLPVARHFSANGPSPARDMEDLSRRLTAGMFAVKLPSQMLRKVDMMSMRAGIEVRVPLLDEDVVGLGLSLPHRLKTDGRQGKLVPRLLASRWLPERVARHPKHGFTIPLDVMVPPGFHDALQDLLLGADSRTHAFANDGMVRTWLDGFRAAATAPGARGGTISRGGLYQRVFTVLALELWMRDYGLTW